MSLGHDQLARRHEKKTLRDRLAGLLNPAPQPASVTEEEPKPNRAARRALLRQKPGEMRMRMERAYLARAQRKAKRGYKRSHVRVRQVAQAAYQKGLVDGNTATINAIKATITPKYRNKWAPRFWLKALAKVRA